MLEYNKSSVISGGKVRPMGTVRFKPTNKIAFSKTPIQFVTFPGVREKLMAIDGWKDALREFVDDFVAKHEADAESPDSES
jgi:hypothetical protein